MNVEVFSEFVNATGNDSVTSNSPLWLGIPNATVDASVKSHASSHEAYIAFLSMCFRRYSMCVIRSKLVALLRSSSGRPGVPRCFIHSSYHLSSSRLRYASFPGVSRIWVKRWRTLFLGTAGKTCSNAPQSSRSPFRQRALMMTQASRASSS